MAKKPGISLTHWKWKKELCRYVKGLNNKELLDDVLQNQIAWGDDRGPDHKDMFMIDASMRELEKRLGEEWLAR